ncbi:MAG: IclR family transcriptional regulator [Anaerolineales bacterium]
MSNSNYTIESLARGLSVLTLFSRERPALTFSQIVAASGLNKSTVFRIVSTLTTHGFLQFEPDTRWYRPGLNVLHLGFTALSSLELRQVARPYLERLSSQVGYTVSLGVLDSMDVIYIDRVRNREPIGVVLGLGSRIPAHCASLGKAMLAFLSADELERRLAAAGLSPCTTNSLPSRAALLEDLARVRLRGYSVNDQEWVLGLRSTAAPVLGDDGIAAAAVNIAVSASELTRTELEEKLSPVVRDTAQEISRAIGYAPSASPI